MPNLNRVILMGHLTRDPEVRTFTTGGKVAKFGLAVNNRKKLPDGSWGDEPVFLDVQAFQGDKGSLADRVAEYLHKGSPALVEGHLVMDSWLAQDGSKRTKLLVKAENVQFLGQRGDGPGPSQGRPIQEHGPKAQQAPKPADEEIPW